MRRPTRPTRRTSARTSRAAQRVSVRLTDFGIAKLLDVQGVTSTGQVLGSPAHMAPEQIEGGEVDARSDVFGVGVLLYECMVGHLPFDGANPAQVLRRVLDGVYPEAYREHPIVGSSWSKILDRALSPGPRPTASPDANAMRDAVAAELQRLDVAAPERDLEAWIDDPATFDEARVGASSSTGSARFWRGRRASEATSSRRRPTTIERSRIARTIRTSCESSRG